MLFVEFINASLVPLFRCQINCIERLQLLEIIALTGAYWAIRQSICPEILLISTILWGFAHIRRKLTPICFVVTHVTVRDPDGLSLLCLWEVGDPGGSWRSTASLSTLRHNSADSRVELDHGRCCWYRDCRCFYEHRVVCQNLLRFTTAPSWLTSRREWSVQLLGWAFDTHSLITAIVHYGHDRNLCLLDWRRYVHAWPALIYSTADLHYRHPFILD